jgi:hypothetical protein
MSLPYFGSKDSKVAEMSIPRLQAEEVGERERETGGEKKSKK